MSDSASGCSAPFSKSVSVEDRIRNRYAEQGEVTLDFLEETLPADDENLAPYLASALNDRKTPGVIDPKEEQTIRDKFDEAQNYLIKNSQEHSPFFARFKRMSESAT